MKELSSKAMSLLREYNKQEKDGVIIIVYQVGGNVVSFSDGSAKDIIETTMNSLATILSECALGLSIADQEKLVGSICDTLNETTFNKIEWKSKGD